MDPLSALSSGETQSDEWSTYYKNVDLISFIRNDLDRLYITGIEDGFFQSKQRRDALLAILLIWAYHHPVLMYKQGMHEVAGYVLFCVEEELAAWQKTASPSSPSSSPSPPSSSPSSSSPTPSPLSPLSPSSLWAQLGPAFQSPHTEAYTYHLFARIMDELEPLYDPVSLTPKGAENLPFVVQYCVKLQGMRRTLHSYTPTLLHEHTQSITHIHTHEHQHKNSYPHPPTHTQSTTCATWTHSCART
ncbi:hypothetical protein B484DRAFT_329860 [Ochromonadaceae sp. CCMP2298]|nr:hypothetical protein B484DRAFT_329860 [Ochromonadaceae sp. CCMP2298]